MFGQIPTCDIMEFQRLLWAGGRRPDQNNVGNPVNNVGSVQQQQQQFVGAPQQSGIISGIHGGSSGVITTNASSPAFMQNNMLLVPTPTRQNNFLQNHQPTVTVATFTQQQQSRYTPTPTPPAPPPAYTRIINQSHAYASSGQQTQQQHYSQTVPLDLGKQQVEARARDMVPEFEEEYFITSSTTATPVKSHHHSHGGRSGNANSGRQSHSNQIIQRSQSHNVNVPTSQALSEHLARAYQEQLQQAQRLIQEQAQAQTQVQHTQHQQSYRGQKKQQIRHEEDVYQAQVEMHAQSDGEQDDNEQDEDYVQEEEEEQVDERDEEWEPNVEGDGPWKCPHCRKTYKRRTNYATHVKSHTSPRHQEQLQHFKCPLCQQSFRKEKTFQKHMKLHDRQQQQQPSAVPTTTPERHHSLQKGQLEAAISSIVGVSGPIGVSVGGLVAQNDRVENSHQSPQKLPGEQSQQPSYQGKVTIPFPSFQFKCDFCPLEFSAQTQLKAHESVHLAENPLKCGSCKKVFLRDAELNQHIKAHLTETIWKCAICTARFDGYKQYRAHLQSHLAAPYKPKTDADEVEAEKPEKGEEQEAEKATGVVEDQTAAAPKASPPEAEDSCGIRLTLVTDDSVGDDSAKGTQENDEKKGEENSADPEKKEYPKTVINVHRDNSTPSTSKQSSASNSNDRGRNSGVSHSARSNFKVTGKKAQAALGLGGSGRSPYESKLQIKRSSNKANEYVVVTPVPVALRKPHVVVHEIDSDNDDDLVVLQESIRTPYRTFPVIASVRGGKRTLIRAPTHPVPHKPSRPPPPPPSSSSKSKGRGRQQRERRPPPPKKSRHHVRFSKYNIDDDEDDREGGNDYFDDHHADHDDDDDFIPPSPARVAVVPMVSEARIIEFECIICKGHWPTRAALQEHQEIEYCNKKTLEIKLLRFEEDPALDFEVIEVDENAGGGEGGPEPAPADDEALEGEDENDDPMF